MPLDAWGLIVSLEQIKVFTSWLRPLRGAGVRLDLLQKPELENLPFDGGPHVGRLDVELDEGRVEMPEQLQLQDDVFRVRAVVVAEVDFRLEGKRHLLRDISCLSNLLDTRAPWLNVIKALALMTRAVGSSIGPPQRACRHIAKLRNIGLFKKKMFSLNIGEKFFKFHIRAFWVNLTHWKLTRKTEIPNHEP